MSGDAVVLDGYNVAIAGCLTVSFQRYPESQLGASAEAPRSHGALPVELISPGTGILPVREGEGVWLGLLPKENRRCAVTVGWLTTVGTKDAPLSWSGAPTSLQVISGLRDASGTLCPFVRFPLSPEFKPCIGVLMSADGRDAIEIRFVDVAEYEGRSGKSAPPPMSVHDSYRGWLLP